jgi:small subunit ribosomal protein S6e
LAQFKITVSDKNGKTITQELKDKTAQPLLGTKVGSIIDSSIIGIGGGRLKVTGGSDKSGTPMRADVHGGVKKYVLLSTGVGNRSEARIRKLVRGNMITEEIYQINSMLIEGVLPEKREDVKNSDAETASANKK